MRIAIVTGPFLSVPPAPCGSGERIWLGMAKEFVRQGHEARILACGVPGLPESSHDGGVEITRRMRFRSTPRFALNAAQDLAYSFRQALLLRRWEADVVLSNSLSLPFWKPLLGIDAPFVPVINRAPKGQLRAYRFLPDTYFAAPSAYIQARCLREAPKAKDRIHKIPNPVDSALFNPSGPGGPADPKAILFAGRLHPEKGLDLLLSAFREAHLQDDQLRLLIAGPSTVEEGGGGGEYLARLKAAAKGLPVEFLGPVRDRLELARLYRACGVFCLPSLALHGEALPVAPLEAMACGSVPVCSDLPQFRDFLRHEQNGLVFARRSHDASSQLAASFLRLAHSPREHRRLARASLRRSAAFSESAVATRYLELFHRILRGRK